MESTTVRVEYVFDNGNHPCRRFRDKMYSLFGNKVEYVDWNIPRVRATHRHRKIPFLRFTKPGPGGESSEPLSHFVEGKECIRMVRKWIDDKALIYPEFLNSTRVQRIVKNVKSK